MALWILMWFEQLFARRGTNNCQTKIIIFSSRKHDERTRYSEKGRSYTIHITGFADFSSWHPPSAAHQAVDYINKGVNFFTSEKISCCLQCSWIFIAKRRIYFSRTDSVVTDSVSNTAHERLKKAEPDIPDHGVGRIFPANSSTLQMGNRNQQ